MKLLTKTTIYHVLLAIFIFTLGGIITHQIVTGLINVDLNQYFERIEARVLERLGEGDSIRSRRVQVLKLDQPLVIPDAIQDTIFYNGKWNVPVKKKIIYRTQDGQHYRIFIYKSFEEADDELEAVNSTVIYLGIAFLTVFIIFNYFLSRSIWLPFYHTLRQIKDFNIHDTQPLALKPTQVREFKEMNAIFVEMADKIRRDYHNLKEFTENTTHEIQTPLAIIKTKLELLMETGVLDQDQSKLVASAYQSTSKLSKLSRALTLITRIENQEFAGHSKELDFSQSLEHCLEEGFEDLIELRKIQLEKQISPQVILEISPLLADILISNLIKNAIKHNYDEGFISISLNPKSLLIMNTGPKPRKRPQELFERFQRGKNDSESLGLGLAIVQKICEVSGYQIQYVYEDELHKIEVQFLAKN